MPLPLQLIEKLRGYLRRIVDTFSARLDTLSATGIPLGLSLRQTQQLSHDVKRNPADGHPGRRPSREPAGLSDRSESSEFRTETGDDLQHLLAWSKFPKPDPVLVTAPFGFGKSTLLAAMAVKTAQSALESLEAAERIDPAPAFCVPLPVRLRAVKLAGTWPEVLAAAVDQYASAALPEERLTADEIRLLNARGLLLCLYDGHDELGETAGRDVFREIESFHRSASPYLISSRHSDLGFGREQVHELRELSDESIRAMLDGVLADAATEHRRSVQERYDTLEPAIGALLRRPLFLAAWAHAAREGPARKLPRDIDQLMELVTLRCFDRVHKTLPGCPATAKEQLKTFASLGHYLLADADASFDDAPRSDAARAGWLRENYLDLLPPPPGYDPDATQSLAEALGLLTPCGVGEGSAGKIAVTEYLVGRHLADAAKTDDAGRRAFVELLRRWCYRPRTYDTLDYVVYRLTHTAAEDGNRTAMELLERMIRWMCDTSDQEPYRANQQKRKVSVPVSDCLVHPAAWCALRLADRMELKALRPIVDSALRSAGIGATNLRADSTLALIEGSTATYVARDNQNKQAWLAAIQVAAGRVAEGEAAALVGRLIDRYAVADENKEAWLAAIRAAAGRVAEGEAAALVGQLTERCLASYVAGDPQNKEAWLAAIQVATRRVAKGEAAALAGRLIDGYAAADYEDKDAWIAAIWGIVSRAEAAPLIWRLIEHHAAADDLDKREWAMAVRRVAGRVTEGEAAAVVGRLIDCYAAADDDEKEAWAAAIWGAAERVAEGEAAAVVARLIDSYAAAGIDRRTWVAAIGVAAERVAAGEAAAVVARLIEHYAGADNNNEAWLAAVGMAAERVTDGEATALIGRLIDHYAGAGENKEAWLAAIRVVAKRVAEGDAAPLVGRLIDGYITTDDEEKEAWAAAIRGAAERVAEGKAAALAGRLIRGYAAVDDVDKQEWAMAIHGTAGRVAEGEAAALVGRLIDHYVAADKDRGTWTAAIAVAAGRVAEGEAAALVGRLIDHYVAAGDEEKDALTAAIRRATERVAEEKAAALAGRLIDGYALAADKAKKAWVAAIGVAAGRVEEEAAARLVERLIGGYAASRDQDRGAWLGAIRRAATRAAEEVAADLVQWLIADYAVARDEDNGTWVAIINEVVMRLTSPAHVIRAISPVLSDAKLRSTGLHLAVQQDIVGLIAVIGDELDDTAKATGRRVLVRLEPLLRTDPRLKLDASNMAVPQGDPLRLLLGLGPTWSDLEIGLLRAFAKAKNEAGKKGEGGWYTWSGLEEILPDYGIYRNRVTLETIKPLLKRLVDHSMLELHPQSKTIMRYRITQSGRTFLKNHPA